MLLRPRTVTPASLHARRANALKSTGPQTEQGKARVALNPLKHGRSAVDLPEKLARAGYQQSAAEWRAIRARIARTFQSAPVVPGPGTLERPGGAAPPEPQRAGNLDRHLGSTVSGPTFEKKMDRLANCVWCAHRDWQQHSEAKLKSPFNCKIKPSRVVDRMRIGPAGHRPPLDRPRTSKLASEAELKTCCIIVSSGFFLKALAPK